MIAQCHTPEVLKTWKGLPSPFSVHLNSGSYERGHNFLLWLPVNSRCSACLLARPKTAKSSMKISKNFCGLGGMSRFNKHRVGHKICASQSQSLTKTKPKHLQDRHTSHEWAIQLGQHSFWKLSPTIMSETQLFIKINPGGFRFGMGD